MKALGKDRIEGFKITGKRQPVIPERLRIQEEMKRKEEERMRKLKEGAGIDEAKDASQTVATAA